MTADLYRRAFARAAEILGGKEQLAEHLQVNLEGLRKWSTRAARPPVHVLQRLAEVVTREIVMNHGRAPAGAKVTMRRKKFKR
jgi:hypothetical protein